MRKITERVRILLLYLTTFTLLADQGVNAHIHLFEAHHHDGNHHQHSAEIHTDHFTEHNASVGHSEVIDLDLDYRTSSPEKQKSPLIALTYDPPELGVPGAATRINRLLISDGWLDYPELSTRHPRAPPINI